jgi:hypothetical protein
VNTIHEVLADLSRLQGVRGSALVTSDGIMVANAFGKEIDEDVIAGLASFMISTTRRSLEEGQLGRFTRLVLASTHGKIVLIDLVDSFLCVLSDQFTDLDQCMPEIQEAARRIKRLAQIA